MVTKTLTFTAGEDEQESRLEPYLKGFDLALFIIRWNTFLRSKTKHASEEELKTDWEKVSETWYDMLNSEGISSVINSIE